eukprot:9317205-Pyramimonas_sp.AAC.1
MAAFLPARRRPASTIGGKWPALPSAPPWQPRRSPRTSAAAAPPAPAATSHHIIRFSSIT